MTMERTSNGQLGGVRIAAKGRMFVAVPSVLALGWVGLTVYLGQALPADQRHLGLLPFLLLGLGACAFMGLVLYLSLWRPESKDVIVADEAGLRLQSRRHGDRDLAWDQVAELGWMNGFNSNSGLIGKLRPAGGVVPGRPMWLCNPAGRRIPPEMHALQDLARRHGAAWNSAYPPIDIDSGLAHPPWYRTIIGRR